MRALVQRVSEASVEVGGEPVGEIGQGLLILLGVSKGDGEDEAHYIVGKTANLRIFNDEAGKFNRSALYIGAELLIVSQFTLYAETRKGRRPSFGDAAAPEVAVSLYERFVDLLRERAPGRVETGEFGAMMHLELVNTGPVTMILER